MKLLKALTHDMNAIINQLSKIVILQASDGHICQTNEELSLYEAYLHYKNQLRCVDNKWFYCRNLKEFQTLQKMYICHICRLYDIEPFTNLSIRSVNEFVNKIVDDDNMYLFSWLIDDPFAGPDYYCLETASDGEYFKIVTVNDIKNAYNQWKRKFEFGITLK